MSDADCHLCGASARLSCFDCGVWFCALDHGGYHKLEDGSCVPVKVLNNDEGRKMVANRDIKVGEVLWREEALCVGPESVSGPVCLACLSELSTVDYLCKTCGYPMCDDDCAGVLHAEECKILSRGPRPTFNADHLSIPNPTAYAGVMALRLAQLKKTSPAKFSLTTPMKTHGEPHGILTMEGVSQLFSLEMSDSDVIRLGRVVDTSSWLVEKYRNAGYRGLYAMAAHLEHNCQPNVKIEMKTAPPFALTATAIQDISSGADISVSFTAATRCHLLRSRELEERWGITCTCARCRDPTELGSELNTLHCPSCLTGGIRPVDPADKSGKWSCKCGKILSHEQAENIVKPLLEEVDLLRRAGKESWLGMADKARGKLHPQHQVLVDIAEEGLSTLCRKQGKSSKDFPKEELEAKLRLATDYLNVLDKVEPGVTRPRAKALFEVGETELDLGFRNFQSDNLSVGPENFLSQVKEVQPKVIEAATILKQLGAKDRFDVFVFQSALQVEARCREMIAALTDMIAQLDKSDDE